MSLFLILGVISSLIWQVLQSLGSSQSTENYNDQSFTSQRKSYSQKVPKSSSSKTSRSTSSKSSSKSFTSPSDWEYSGQREDWESEQSPSSKVDPKVPQDEFVKDSNLETREKPKNINQSGSTYSYQFKKNQKSEYKVNKNADEVYDANYRTINSGKNSEVNQNSDFSEDEEEWI